MSTAITQALYVSIPRYQLETKPEIGGIPIIRKNSMAKRVIEIGIFLAMSFN
jgi:hypothetical protein